MPDILINPEQLKLIVSTLSAERSVVIAGLINSICPVYGINTKDILEEFLASVIHESGGFRIKEENLNYSTPERLRAIWPAHFKTVEAAKSYCNNPQKLANYIYGTTSIAKSLGNIKPEDGYAFRGAGFIQLTGRYAATAYTKYKGIDSPENTMNLLRTQDEYAMDSACWVFAVLKKLIPYAINDDFITITKRINGGTIGMQDRLNILNRIKKYL